MKLLEGADYFIQLVDIPFNKIGGSVTPNDDGTYTILINARNDEAKRRDTLEHELRHIERNDLQSDEDAATVEAQCRGIDVQDGYKLVPVFPSPSALADWLMSFAQKK